MRILDLTRLTLLGAAVYFFGGTGRAQSTGSTPDGSTPATATEEDSGGLKDFLARTVKVTGQVRARWEGPEGSNFTATPSDSYLLTRTRVGLAFQPTSYLRFYGEAQDARAMNYKTNPASTVADPIDFRQGYAEIGAIEGPGAKLRVGRQDMTLGSGRLVSSGDWSNVTKPFDIFRGSVNTSFVKADIVGGSQVLIDPNREDRDRPGERFYGAYTAFGKLIPHASIEPYFFAKTTLNVKGKDGKLGNADVLYGGARLIGTVPGGFDYNAEAVREGGDYADDVIQSLGYVAGGGWTLSRVSWKPHFNSDFAWASGDDGQKDGHHQMFDYLYGSQQPLNSLTGLFCWRNIEDWRAGVDFTPTKKLKVKVDYRDYWLATLADGLYNSAGTKTVFDAKATSNHVGEGVDAMVIATITPKTIVGVGVGNLFPGSYLKQAGKTSGYVYPFVYFTRNL
ncbi:MAG TPA: alginate export family protein [Bryobacteraceae bacterium]|nr:alginate export family protein [Bryobacteraceae bacterium]